MLVSENSLLSKNSHKSSFNNDNNSVSYPSRTIVHPKLEMTEPGDADEQEADVAANEVMSGKVFRKFSGGGAGGGMAVSSQMESQLNHLQGGGQAMPDGLRGMMERGFDRDFSQVRLHTDGEAAGLSSSIHAKAFTHGNDIYFNQGQYAPETSEGQRLVAHELAHVAQGGGKVGRKPKWDDLATNYPMDLSADKLFKDVFGPDFKNEKNWDNTCATRVSIALLKSGEKIFGGWPIGKNSELYAYLKDKYKIKSRLHVILNVRRMKKWLMTNLGKPTRTIFSKDNLEKEIRENLKNKKGILLIDNYHVTLWTGEDCIRRDCWTGDKKRAFFWEI
ncbi:MAG: DUF4157 domain-containing protein [Paludibacteraceae bacterium]|nr:DUF4157 domain-containing protein [Paludibacteraceae bacterium]